MITGSTGAFRGAASRTSENNAGAKVGSPKGGSVSPGACSSIIEWAAEDDRTRMSQGDCGTPKRYL